MERRPQKSQGIQRGRIRVAHAVREAAVCVPFECLEDRRLLSTPSSALALSEQASPMVIRLAATPTASPAKATKSSVTLPDGYSPAQIAKAYGFNLVSGNGAGQTIAIVDAYNDPNIQSDLAVFDKTYGLAAANLTVVNQSGSTKNLPQTNGDWSGEIALDVEWAHAMAPGAKIVLVEASSDSLNNLLTAVNTARHLAGVSVVSMSWGGDEFSGQTKYDSYFTTPAGHRGVTFVASSGDSGSAYGPSWPASSPTVLSVGGTSLSLSSSGVYGTEVGWNGSGGGASSYESVPSYQTSAQKTGQRTTPDVAYNADPNTGFAVYDTVADSYGDPLGWSVIGGTSAGAPQWAAIVAIADQTRAAAGKGTLDGASGTLPTLYSLYGAGTASTYAANFRDVTAGRTSPWLSAHVGYDGVTGLGTPKVSAVVQALTGVASAFANASGSTGPAAGTTTLKSSHGSSSIPAARVEGGAVLPLLTRPVTDAIPSLDRRHAPSVVAVDARPLSISPVLAEITANAGNGRLVPSVAPADRTGAAAETSPPRTMENAEAAPLVKGLAPYAESDPGRPAAVARCGGRFVPAVGAAQGEGVTNGPSDDYRGTSAARDASAVALVPDDVADSRCEPGRITPARGAAVLAGAILCGSWFVGRRADGRKKNLQGAEKCP